ncbi:MAG: VWA domain-containing protein, partial [Chloroflexi bacterium]|nr:VWA domain-containing protein [Chloroflexota bacterium]
PTTSSTGRSLHLSLYSIAAGKAPEDLTIEDVNDPDVIKYVKNFQTLIDHYTIGTTVLNTKIYQGTGFGHFFIMPEDNLIHLYEGTERSFLNGIKTTAPPITESMVMIYPKEGAMPRNNCACIVNADWVSLDQAEAAKVWIDYIRQDEQQRAFMAAGFRPGTDISLRDPASKITTEFGLNPNPPRVVLNPSLTKPEVAAAIDAAWVDIKRPGIVTFVVDTSGSMLGGNIQQAREGMFGALNATASNNQVGFVTFDDAVNDRVPVALLTADHKRKIEGLVEDMRAGGETALYDAIRAGIEMTDAAEGEADAIRAVVVLTDGQANRCQTRLDDLIRTTSRNEVDITSFGGCKSQSIDGPREASGRLVSKQEVIGHSLAIETKHPIQIFFIGIGDDADLDIGRMLAEATGAEFQGAAEEDLAEVLEEFSRYF